MKSLNTKILFIKQYTVTFNRSDCNNHLVLEKLSKITSTDKIEETKGYITDMIKKPHLLNVYKEKSKDKIDQVILRALIKGRFHLTFFITSLQ